LIPHYHKSKSSHPQEGKGIGTCSHDWDFKDQKWGDKKENVGSEKWSHETRQNALQSTLSCIILSESGIYLNSAGFFQASFTCP
jgi:hypothetical protein